MTRSIADQAAAAERQRSLAITNMCLEAGKSVLAAGMIASGISVDQARASLERATGAGASAAPGPIANAGSGPWAVDSAAIYADRAKARSERKPDLQS